MQKEILKENNIYIIDADFNNGGEVELIKILGNYFCIVQCTETGIQWKVMITRLTVKPDAIQ